MPCALCAGCAPGIESPVGGSGIGWRWCGDVAWPCCWPGCGWGGCCGADAVGAVAEAGGGAEACAPRGGGGADVLLVRRRLRVRSPSLGSGGGASWASCSDVSSSLPPMARPPGTLGGGAGAEGVCGLPTPIGFAERPRGVPTGIEEGSWPCGALRHAWMRFLPSG